MLDYLRRIFTSEGEEEEEKLLRLQSEMRKAVGKTVAKVYVTRRALFFFFTDGSRLDITRE